MCFNLYEQLCKINQVKFCKRNHVILQLPSTTNEGELTIIDNAVPIALVKIREQPTEFDISEVAICNEKHRILMSHSPL